MSPIVIVVSNVTDVDFTYSNDGELNLSYTTTTPPTTPIHVSQVSSYSLTGDKSGQMNLTYSVVTPPSNTDKPNPATFDPDSSYADGLIACFLFQEGDPNGTTKNLVDGQPAQLVGTASVHNDHGKFGSALVLADNSNGYVDTGLVIDDPAYTIVVWFKVSQHQSASRLYEQLVSVAGGANYLLVGLKMDSLTKTFEGSFWTKDGLHGQTLSVTGSYDQWYQLTLTRDSDGGTYTAYLNGVSVGTVGSTGSNALNDSGSDLWIGNRKDAPTQIFEGEIDHVLVYSGRCLSSPEVNDLFQNPFQMVG